MHIAVAIVQRGDAVIGGDSQRKGELLGALHTVL